YLLVGVIVAYTALAVVNTLIVATGERRRELGMLRLIGATRGQVIRVLGLEAALAAISGILLGTLISATTLIPFSEAVSQTPMPSGPIWIYLTIVGVAASITLVSTLVPAWALTRTPPVEAAAVG
ncbi:MAG: ABC transporter permease, partial [Actinomycetota bacterium]